MQREQFDITGMHWSTRVERCAAELPGIAEESVSLEGQNSICQAGSTCNRRRLQSRCGKSWALAAENQIKAENVRRVEHKADILLLTV